VGDERNQPKVPPLRRRSRSGSVGMTIV